MKNRPGMAQYLENRTKFDVFFKKAINAKILRLLVFGKKFCSNPKGAIGSSIDLGTGLDSSYISSCIDYGVR